MCFYLKIPFHLPCACICFSKKKNQIEIYELINYNKNYSNNIFNNSNNINFLFVKKIKIWSDKPASEAQSNYGVRGFASPYHSHITGALQAQDNK